MNTGDKIRKEDRLEIYRIMAEEVNVKCIEVNGVVVYEEPLLKDKYPKKYKQFEEIYGE